MSASTGYSLRDFTAYELSTEKWLKFLSPKVRLRVRGRRCDFVSPVVKVNNRRLGAETDPSCTYWSWNVDERFSRPSFIGDEVLEIVVEKQLLLWYKRIMRTRSVTINEVRISDCDPCTLLLYDGRYSTGELEGRIEIGRITFMLSTHLGDDRKTNSTRHS